MNLSRRPSAYYRAIIPLTVIAAVAIALSVASYQYSASMSDKISSVAVENLRVQAQTQAYDLSKSLENRLQSVRDNLQLLANAPAIRQGDFAEGRVLVNTAQQTTAGFTDSYFWIDGDGRLQWAHSFADQKIYDQFYGVDRSDRPYFAEPKSTHRAHFSALQESVDGIPRIYMSYPVLASQDGATVFRGVVASSLNLKSLGEYMNSQLAPGMQGQVSLMDKDGTILYTQNDAIIGKNYFSKEVQDLLFSQYIPAEQQESFNAMLRDSVAGNSGIGEFSSSGTPLMLAYNPVKINTGTDMQNALALHVVVPKSFASDIAFLIDQQRTFSTIVPAIIGVVAVGIAFMIIRANRTLGNTVAERTAELKTANEMLARANKELVAANDQLVAQEKLQSEFVNIAAHELRTPVQPLLGVAEMMESSLDGRNKTEVTREEIELIIRNARRLERLSSDILEVARIESKSMRLDYETFDFNQKMANVADDLRKIIPADKKIELVVRKLPEPLMVEADKTRMYEVLSNLIRNAIKFTDEGNITVAAEKNGGQAVVSVSDAGKGIDSEILPRLFTKFATKSEKGTGLGLFIAKSIVEAHGGKIWAENNKDGGATFTFTIPLSKQIVPENH